MRSSMLRTGFGSGRVPFALVCASAMLFVFVFAGCSHVENAADDVGDAAAEAADHVPGVGEKSLHADLTGAAEVPGPADADASGSASVSLDEEDGEVCYDIDVENIGDAVAAHIHKGAVGVSGPPVVTLPVVDKGMSSCVTGVDHSVVHDIATNPANYYINVHTAEYPKGAARGQLSD